MKKFAQAAAGCLLLAAGVALTSGGSAQAASPCIRHIINHYGGTWTFDASVNVGNIVMIPLSKDQGSKVFPNAKNKPKKDVVAVIGPQQAWEIIYIFGPLNIADGYLNITDMNNVSHRYHYSSFFGGVCPELNHSGSTGAVALNDPADGDVSIDAMTWAGVSAKSPKH